MLKDKIESDLKAALKSGDSLKVSVLRMALAAILNKTIALVKKDVGLEDQEILEVLQSELKKRKDAQDQFNLGGRKDLAAKEEKEAEILRAYLPPDFSQEELERIVAESIREVGARGQQDFGKAMKQAMSILKGRVEGNRVAEAVKKALAQ
ncbi:MAG: GatB/YqeY domain-containing protein [Patescibacteria group bacterium]